MSLSASGNVSGSSPRCTALFEQGRIDRLLKDAAALQQAGMVRNYVQAIRLAHPSDGTALTESIERWSCWALAQADRIDPMIGDSFLKSMRDEDET